jgi:hypothetical protein
MKTKTKIALAVMLGVLFVAVPSATPKGKPPSGLTLGVVCTSTGGPEPGEMDACAVTATGLASETYLLVATDSCGLVEYVSHFNPVAGTINVNVNLSDPICPGNTGWTFNLYLIGHKGAPTLVATTWAADPD